MNVKSLAASAVITSIVLLSGCASVSKADIDSLRSQVQQAQSAADAAASTAAAARTEAASATAIAEKAAADAAAAKAQSEATDSKIDRMFKKAMYK